MSQGDEVWNRVSAILNDGVMAHVERKQVDTREFLVDVEGRLNELINEYQNDLKQDQVLVPLTAACVHGENINQELHNAIVAINTVTDQQLRFQLTVFIDDYRRILQHSREPERAQVLAELEEHFREGPLTLPLEAGKMETEEMRRSCKIVEAEAKKLMQLHRNTIRFLATLSKDKKLKSSKDERTSKEQEAFQYFRDVLTKPAVRGVLDSSEYSLLIQHLDTIHPEGIHTNTKNPSSSHHPNSSYTLPLNNASTMSMMSTDGKTRPSTKVSTADKPH